MQNLPILLLSLLGPAAIVIGVYLFIYRREEQIPKNFFILSALILMTLHAIPLLGYQSAWQNRFKQQTQKYNDKIANLNSKHAEEIDRLKNAYTKEIAFVEWKNKVFVNNADMEKALAQSKDEYNLTENEVQTWRNLAENNTMDKLIPKRNTNEILDEYQQRLKKCLASIRSGHTLMNSEIRMLSDNINTIRFIGKEYEKTLTVFKDLYNDIITNSQNGTVMERPKKKKVLFFTVKQKEYDQLLEQYYEAQGNQKAVAEVAVKLKQAIDQAENEFASINQKFESNLEFLSNNAGNVSYNSEKLEGLIQAAIKEANIVSKGTRTPYKLPKVVGNKIKKN